MSEEAKIESGSASEQLSLGDFTETVPKKNRTKVKLLKHMRPALAKLENERMAIARHHIDDVEEEFFPLCTQESVEFGHKKLTLWCPKCGSEDEISERESWTPKCPMCGNTDQFSHSKAYVTLINVPPSAPDEDDGFTEYVTFAVSYRSNYGERTIEKSINGNSLCFGVYAAETGIRTIEDRKECVGNTSRISGCIPIDKTQQEQFSSLLEGANKYNQDALEARKKRNNKTPKVIESDERLDIELPSVEDVFKNLSVRNIAFYISERYGLVKTAAVFDGETRTTQIMKPTKDVNAPRESWSYATNGIFVVNDKLKEIEIYHPEKIYDEFVYVYDKAQSLTGAMLVKRLIRIRYSYNNTYETIQVYASEKYRWYYTKKKCYQYYVHNGAFEPDRSHGYEFEYNSHGPYCYQELDDVCEIVKDTDVKYSGFIEALKCNLTSLTSKTDYFQSWYECPAIEQLTKVGLYRLAKEVLDEPCHRPWLNDAPDIKSMLGVTKTELRLIRQINPGGDDLLRIKTLLTMAPNLTLDDWTRVTAFDNHYYRNYAGMRQGGNGVDMVIRTCHIPPRPIELRKLLDYVDALGEYQFITDKTEALQIYSDYLQMVCDLEYDLTDKSKLFPSSLEKEHRKAVVIYNTMKQEMDEKRFARRHREMTVYEYKSKEDGMCVVAPKKGEDMISEGTNLHHCVASYVNRVTSGDTNILFIRHIDDPDTSFYTVEVRNNRVIQVHGMQNHPPTPDVRDFIRKWCSKKNIVCGNGTYMGA